MQTALSPVVESTNGIQTKKVNLYQIIYQDGLPADLDCIIEDTRHIPESTVSPIYENYHILRLYPKFEGADYYGTTSWRMYEKTGLRAKNIYKFINENPANAYVYYQCGGGLKYPLVANIKTKADIGNAVKRIIDLKVFKTPDIEYKWVDVYANFFVADKQTWDRYIPVLKHVLGLAQSDPLLKKLLDKTFGFRGRPYPLTCFVLEYIFGLFLADNPDIKWKQIPMFPELGPPLKDIYQKHKATYGYGDKGTAHRYIDTYEKLFAQFRNRPVTVLEIGVSHGHSLRMWREYFHPKTRIIGIDLQRPSLDIKGCEFHQCNQVDTLKLRRIFHNTRFDIIVDDGSHVLEHQLKTFRALFQRLNSGGLYIIEDVGGGSKEPDKDIKVLQTLGNCDVYDTRQESGQYDDILMVWIR